MRGCGKVGQLGTSQQFDVGATVRTAGTSFAVYSNDGETFLPPAGVGRILGTQRARRTRVEPLAGKRSNRINRRSDDEFTVDLTAS